MRRPRPHQTAELETGRHKKKRADTQINQTGDNAKSQPALPVRHAAAAGVAITAAAGLLYGLYGRPDLPDQPLYKRTAELAQKQAETKAEIEALDTAFDAAQNAAAKHPDDITSWLQLALAAARTVNSRVEIDAVVILNRFVALLDFGCSDTTLFSYIFDRGFVGFSSTH